MAERQDLVDVFREAWHAADERGEAGERTHAGLMAVFAYLAEEERCGGCKGIGAHRKHCPQHPNYHPWRLLADRAEAIGDVIGGNDPGLANRAYDLASRITAGMNDHPWRPRKPSA